MAGPAAEVRQMVTASPTAEVRQTWRPWAAPPAAPEPESWGAPLTVVLAGEDEDTARAEPHIWRGID